MRFVVYQVCLLATLEVRRSTKFIFQKIKSMLYLLMSHFITLHDTFLLLGSEVDKSYKILIKTSNVTEHIESNIQIIEAPRTDDPIIQYV